MMKLFRMIFTTSVLLSSLLAVEVDNNEVVNTLIASHNKSTVLIDLLQQEVDSLKQQVTILNKNKILRKTAALSNVDTNGLIVTAWMANKRQAPSIQSKIVSSLQIGTRLKTISYYENWYKLEDGSYISNRGVEKILPTKIKTKKKANLRSYPFIKDETLIETVNAKTDLIAIASTRNNEWFILENGTYVLKNEIEAIENER